MLDTVKAARRLRKIAQFIEASATRPEPVPTTLNVFVQIPGAKGGPIAIFQHTVKPGERVEFELPPQNGTKWLVEVK